MEVRFNMITFPPSLSLPPLPLSRHVHPLLDFGWVHEEGVQDGDIVGQHCDVQVVVLLWGGSGGGKGEREGS